MAMWRLLALVAIGVALLWEGRPAYSFAYLFLVLFFLWQHWQTKAASQIRISRRPQENRFFPQDFGEVQLNVVNNSNFPFPWVSLGDKIPHNLLAGGRLERLVFPLPGRAQNELSFNLSPRQRGVYRLGPLELAVGDLFGINTQRFSVPDFQTVVVYPQVHPLTELALPARLPFGNLQAVRRIYPDPTRLAGVRPYEQGDPLRTLHWPATARTHSLQVKQFEHTVTANCLIFLNLHEKDYEVASFYPTTELAISTAASLASALITAGESCGLFTNGSLTEYLPDQKISLSGQDQTLQIPAGQGLAQLTEILTVLAGLEPQLLDFVTLLRSQEQVYAPGSILLWIVPQDSPEILAEAEKQVRAGRQVLLFIVGAKVLHPGLLHRPQGASLQMFAVRSQGGLNHEH